MNRGEMQGLFHQVAHLVEQQHRLQLEMLDAWQTLIGVSEERGPRVASDPGSDVPTSASDRVVYSVAETAKMLGLSDNSTYAAIQRSEIPALRVGRKILVPRPGPQREAFLRLAERCRCANASPADAAFPIVNLPGLSLWSGHVRPIQASWE